MKPGDTVQVAGYDVVARISVNYFHCVTNEIAVLNNNSTHYLVVALDSHSKEEGGALLQSFTYGSSNISLRRAYHQALVAAVTAATLPDYLSEDEE